MADKTKEISKQQIISYYMNSCQENDVVPRSVFKFCSNLGIDDAQFYKHFLYMNRTFFGLYNLLYDLKANIDTKAYLKYLSN